MTDWHRRSKFARLGAWVVAAVLAGCGGGGGGTDSGGTPPATVTIPLSAAIANYVNQARSATVSVSGSVTAAGQTLPVSGSATWTETTGPGTFEGQAALRKNMSINGSLSVAGQSAPFSDVSQAYFDPNYRPLGATSSSGYCVTTSSSAMPATAHVGDTGPWFTQACYTSSAKLSTTGTITTAYVIEPETAATAVLKLLVTTTANGQTLSSHNTFRVGTDGAITRLQDQAALQVGGDSLSLTITYQ
jgi:hypothetical protein